MLVLEVPAIVLFRRGRALERPNERSNPRRSLGAGQVLTRIDGRDFARGEMRRGLLKGPTGTQEVEVARDALARFKPLVELVSLHDRPATA